jgi:hypothetical protein
MIGAPSWAADRFGDQPRSVGGTVEAQTAGCELGSSRREESGKITIIFLVP